MDVEYIKDNYHFETLTDEHDLSDFSCDSEDLNDFLKNDALPQQKEKLNLTKLCVCEGEIVGFVTLLTDVLKLDSVRDDDIKGLIKDKLNISVRNNIPSIKIGRFAVDKKYSGKGLGTFILTNVIDNIKELSENNVGLRFIIVNAYAKAYSFYVNHIGFENLKKDDSLLKNIAFIINVDPERTFMLYLDIASIK